MANLPEIAERTYPAQVYFFDTDAGGVVHNVAYLRMIEVARSDFAEYLDWPLAEMVKAGGICPVVARTEIDYLKPARIGDDLKIHCKLEEMQRVRFTISFLMVRLGDGAEICRCRQDMVPVDLASGKPRPLRSDWREKWGTS